MANNDQATGEGTGTAQEVALAAYALRTHAGAYGAKLADQLEAGHAERQRPKAEQEPPPPPPPPPA